MTSLPALIEEWQKKFQKQYVDTEFYVDEFIRKAMTAVAKEMKEAVLHGDTVDVEDGTEYEYNVEMAAKAFLGEDK